jgi:hypothetical protein
MTVEHIPAIHAAKVGMRYPARVTGVMSDRLCLELDLSAIAPGRSPRLTAVLLFDRTLGAAAARAIPRDERFEVVLIDDPRQGDLLASLPANPAWLTWNNGTMRQLAQRMRESGESDLLPILADALEEAGCAEHDLLARCRRPGEDNLKWLIELLATQE